MGKDLKGKELGTGLSQRKNGKYCGRFINRFGNRESVYGDTVKEVKNKIAELKAADISRSNVAESKIILDSWFEKWMDVYKISVRENTRRQYKTIYELKISPVLGRKKLTNITKLQITDLINSLAKDGYGWETLNKVRIILVDMFDRALEDDFVTKNPAKGVRLPICRPKNEAKALTVEDQKEFLDCAKGTFYYNLFVVAIMTGLRPGELYALTEDDIDFEKNEIHVRHTLVYQKLGDDEQKEFHMGPPKTLSSDRIVPFSETCRAALLKQIMQHKIVRNRVRNHDPKVKKRFDEFSECIFTTQRGTPLNAELYSAAIERIVDEINLMRDPVDYMDVFSGHAFRHTFATRCFEAGIAPKTVQAYLGHASLQMTMDLYTDVLEQKKQDDMMIFEAAMEVEKPEIEQFDSKKIIKMCG